jgi:uncharacterized protein (TIGR03437 family)
MFMLVPRSVLLTACFCAFLTMLPANEAWAPVTAPEHVHDPQRVGTPDASAASAATFPVSDWWVQGGAHGLRFSFGNDGVAGPGVAIHWQRPAIAAGDAGAAEGATVVSAHTADILRRDAWERDHVPLIQRQVFPGIDVAVHGRQGVPEFDFEVSPGARVAEVRYGFEAGARVGLTPEGGLAIERDGRRFVQRPPLAWQTVDGRQVMVDVSFVLDRDGAVSFRAGKYRKDLPLVIDPTVEFSTYLAREGDGQVSPLAMAKAPNGDIFLLVGSGGSDLPEQGAFHVPYPDQTAAYVLARIHGTTHQLLSRTVLPKDDPFDTYNSALLTVDVNGSPWLVIPSNSAKVPAMNPSIGTVSSSTARGRRRALLVRLSPDASTVSYSAYVGCTNDLRLHSLDAGPDSSVVLVASSTCSDFPTTAGAFQHQHPGTHVGPRAGILKLDASTGTVRYGTYFGAFPQSVIPDLRAVVDHSGRAVMAATAYSDQLPATPGVLGQPTPEAASIYAGALSADGSRLEFGTYFGSPSFDRFLGMAIGQDDSIYISGLPGSGFPTTTGAFIAPGEARSYFVSRLAKDGKKFLYSSLPLRGQMEGIHTHLAVMGNGDIAIATNEADIGMMTSADAFSTWQRGYGVIRLSADGTTVRFSSAIPSEYGAVPRAILALDSGTVAVTGRALPGHAVRSADAWTSVGESSFEESASPGFLTLIDLDSPTICSFATQLSRNPVPSGRTTGLLTVNTSPGCPWLVEENAAPALRFRSLPGMVGPGSVEYDTEPNLQRKPVSYEIRVGKGSFPFTQEAGTCDFFEILPEFLSFPAAGGYKSVDARAVEWCAWSVGASSAWFVNPNESPAGALSPHAERVGQATLSVAAPVNAFGPRSGIAVLGSKQLTITQEGGACTASLSPLALNVPVSGMETNLTLQTNGVGCEWLAIGGPGVQFPGTRAGVGSAVVPIRIETNPSNTTRQTHVWLANKKVEITQAAGQCSAMFPQPVTEVPHVGGGVMLRVEATGEACGWNATVNQPWLRIEASPSGGSGYLSLFVEPNLTAATREATVSNLGKTAIIRQAGNNTAFVQFQIPNGIGLKINGVYEAEPASRTYPLGTTLTLEPDAYRTHEPNILDEVIGWRDWPQKNRTITLNSNNVVLELLTRRLVRLAVEKTPGGTVDIQVAGTPSETYPEFYIPSAGQSSLFYQATARPAAGYRFYGWQKPDRNEYLAGPELREGDGLGWYLRPRFERTTPPIGVHFVPESLELVVYANFARSTHRFEIVAADGPVFGTAGAPCSDGIEGIRTAGYGPVGQRTMLIFEPSPDGLRASGKKTVECTFNVRGGPNSSVYSFPIRFTVEGVEAAAEPPPPPPSGSVAISHGATFSRTPLSPGGLFSLFGPDLASGTTTPSALPLPLLLRGAQLRIYSEVDFATRYAELLYVSPTQINFFVPEDLPVGSARVQQYRDGALVREIPMQVATSAPGIFYVGIQNGGPAPAGYGVLVSGNRQFPMPIYECPGGQCNLSYLEMGGTNDQLYLTLYGTGLRKLRPQDLSFTANGIPIPVEYLGRHSYFVGLDQVNLRVPRSLRGSGFVMIELKAGGTTVNAGRVHF